MRNHADPVLRNAVLPVRPRHLPAELLRRLLLTEERLVLFICVENACRSLMAEAIFNADPPEGWRAVSGGTRPAARPDPRTGPMLLEIGLAPPRHPPQPLTGEMMDRASVRVTMGCLDSASCPVRLRTLELTDWSLPDPGQLDDAGFRRVRDELVGRVRRLRGQLAPAAPSVRGASPLSRIPPTP